VLEQRMLLASRSGSFSSW